MKIEGLLDENKKIYLTKYLEKNRNFLEKITKINISNLPILVKYVEKEDFEKIWGKLNKPNDFFNNFKSIIRELTKNLDDNTQNALWDLIECLTLGEPIVAFVSDLDFRELIKLHTDKIIESPGIYIKKKDDDNANLDFGILYCLIKAQIYYSISRKGILINYDGIDTFLYSSLALKAMENSEYENLLKHQKFIRLGGNWAIPIVLAANNKNLIDFMADENLIRQLIFGEKINEIEWLMKIIKNVMINRTNPYYLNHMIASDENVTEEATVIIGSDRYRIVKYESNAVKVFKNDSLKEEKPTKSILIKINDEKKLGIKDKHTRTIGSKIISELNK